MESFYSLIWEGLRKIKSFFQMQSFYMLYNFSEMWVGWQEFLSFLVLFCSLTLQLNLDRRNVQANTVFSHSCIGGFGSDFMVLPQGSLTHWPTLTMEPLRVTARYRNIVLLLWEAQ